MIRMVVGKRLLRNILVFLTVVLSDNQENVGTWAKPATIHKAKSMSEVVSSEGLYSTADKVVILNVTSFENTVLGTDQAWLVEFYNSWCGHCRRFAPIWKEFAADVSDWEAAVRIGVVDCVVEANTPLCRDYEIMHYPTLRFFSAYHVKGDFGKDTDKGKDAEAMRQILVGILEKEQLEGRGAHWPNITPYRSADLHNLWKDVPTSVLYSVLIFKDKTGGVGSDLVLDLSPVHEIQSRTVSHENEALAKLLQVPFFPCVVIVERNKLKGEIIYTHDRSRKGFLIMIHAFLRTKGIEIPVESEEEPEEAVKVISTHNDDDLQKQVKQLMSERGDVAFLADLEHALRYSLRHEVGSRKHMTGPVLRALCNYLRVITRFFPLSRNGAHLLQGMYDYVSGLKELTGEDWKHRLSSEETALEGPAWMEREDFLGCRGSRPNFRGYSCSLWTMFHTLTVSALNSQESGEPREVLEAILGYVTHFFGCAECSKHFQEMAAKTMFSEVNTLTDSVLWLWEAHNKVNARLAGDATEDPEFPKIQFPSVDRCPGCRDSGDWVKDHVLQYLQSVYNHEALSPVGAVGSNAVMGHASQFISPGSDMSTLDMSLT